jgi:hypothetical protein
MARIGLLKLLVLLFAFSVTTLTTSMLSAQENKKDVVSVMRDAIAECWIVSPFSSASSPSSVLVEMELTLDGKPVANSIKMLGFEGGDDVSAERVFGTALRAIQRCGARGFELPEDQYDTWRRMELTFNLDGLF